jgi:hypothetical protein
MKNNSFWKQFLEDLPYGILFALCCGGIGGAVMAMFIAMNRLLR